MRAFSHIKRGFAFAGLHSWADKLAFRFQQLKYHRANKRFLRERGKELILPSDYTLYETYRLHYAQYMTDGEQTAREILEDCLPHLDHSAGIAVLDLGCGPLRVLRHLPSLLPSHSSCTGADSNMLTIQWGKQHFPNITLLPCGQVPPVLLQDRSFQLIIAYSLFTHIPFARHEVWLDELYRLAAPGAVIYLTTHGAYFNGQLSAKEKKLLLKTGGYTRPYPITGHRLMTTYNQADHFQQLVQQRFQLLHHYPGHTHPNKAGHQDCWILQRKP